MAKKPVNEICLRIAKLRTDATGPRGKSRFAKQLGLSPSAYHYYEQDRTPPAEILVRVVEVTGADLHWLLTGEPSGDAALTAEDHPVLRRAAKLLADYPDAAKPLDAFVTLLMEARKFPEKPKANEIQETLKTEVATHTPPVEHRSGPPVPPADTGREAWIPILGRTAAGFARFWGKDEDTSGLTTLSDLVARRAAWRARSIQPAIAAPSETDSSPSPAPVQLVTLSAPDQHETAEFISANTLKTRYPDAFALRVDGDSMAPDIHRGDLVILSPSVQAVEGLPAVIQLTGQIGVTCKLYRTDGQQVHLVPTNGSYEIATVDAGQVDWALRVLACVRA